MDLAMKPVAHLGRVPVYDISTRNQMATHQPRFSVREDVTHEALQQQICNTCVHRRDRRVVVDGHRVHCHPDKALFGAWLWDDKCIVPDGNVHPHRYRKAADGTQVPYQIIARLNSCGWEPRRWNYTGCTDCVHFVQLHHSQQVEGRYLRSPFLQLFGVNGYCNLPPEGVDVVVNGQSVHTHCAYQQRPIIMRDVPSCESCAFCLRPASEEWPGANGSGLGVIGNSVVRTGCDRLEQVVARQIAHIDPDALKVEYQLGAINRQLASVERGFYSTFAAELLAIDEIEVTEQLPDGKTTTFLVPTHVRLHFPQAIRTVELDLCFEEATALLSPEPDGRITRVPIPPGHVSVIRSRKDLNLMVVHLRLDPWRARFGMPELRYTRLDLPARGGPGSALLPPLYPERSKADCPRCFPHRACDAHARGLYFDPIADVYTMSHRDARDPRYPAPTPEGILSVEFLDGQLVILDGYGKPPEPMVLFKALRSLKEEIARIVRRQYGRDATRLVSQAQQQLTEVWLRTIEHVPLKKDQYGKIRRVRPSRFPLALYPGYAYQRLHPVAIHETLEHPFEPTFRKPKAIYRTVAMESTVVTPTTLEPSMYVCLAQLHGLNAGGVHGIVLQERNDWRNFGESRWNAQVSVPPPLSRNARVNQFRPDPASDRSSFHLMDVDDFIRANDVGARVQEALDATDIEAGFWDWRTGTYLQPEPVATCWRPPVVLDIEGDPAASWATSYDRANDKANHVEWLDTVVEVNGVMRSNRWRAHGYSIRAAKVRKGGTTDASRWVNEVIDPVDIEADIDLTDEESSSEVEIDLSDDTMSVEAYVLNSIELETEHEMERVEMVEGTSLPFQVGLDFWDKVSEEEQVPYQYIDVYCTACQQIVDSIPVPDNLSPSVPRCRHCHLPETTVALGYRDDWDGYPIHDDERERQVSKRSPEAICLQCGYRQPHFRPGADSCPRCLSPLIFADEGKHYRGQEKRKGSQVWRSSDNKIQRRQLERLGHDCPFYVRKGGYDAQRGESRPPVTAVTITSWHEKNKQRKAKIELR